MVVQAQNRRLSELLSSVPRDSGMSSSSEGLAADEELLVSAKICLPPPLPLPSAAGFRGARQSN
jgi:hypothetical protein